MATMKAILQSALEFTETFADVEVFSAQISTVDMRCPVRLQVDADTLRTFDPVYGSVREERTEKALRLSIQVGNVTLIAVEVAS